MIDPHFAYKILDFIMESGVSALVAGFLIGGFLGACITIAVTEKKTDYGDNVKY